MKHRLGAYMLVVFDPTWAVEDYVGHPLKRLDTCYFLGEIPNVPDHALVVAPDGRIVPMVHTDDIREPFPNEL